MLANFDDTCCVTGCREDLVLEAVHISRYTGPHSNHPANGLCLRVDIHRLFDSFRIAIDPVTLTLVVAPQLIEDPTYGALDGKRMAPGHVPA
ncbi:HNH endonuclease signature motif containing protein [Halomonas sp. Bachu 37]|uniref:HNH endonuclease signature motif containing protein n=1 Tax=Halomonas kashgarensis TaxID=3084920 RepID=UPI0032163406